MQRLMRANQRARAPIDEPFFNYSSRFYRANFHSPPFFPYFRQIISRINTAICRTFTFSRQSTDEICETLTIYPDGGKKREREKERIQIFKLGENLFLNSGRQELDFV